MTLTAIAFALTAIGSNPVSTDAAMFAADHDAALASVPLSQGREQEAIKVLEGQLDRNPDDPAILINLGIAYAQNGDEARARDLFEAALTSPDPIELETANGKATDSRRLARRALKMLERGDFNAATRTALRQ